MAPARHEDDNAETEYHSTPKSYYRQMYYETIDLMSSFILKRFDQPDLQSFTRFAVKCSKGSAI